MWLLVLQQVLLRPQVRQQERYQQDQQPELPQRVLARQIDLVLVPAWQRDQQLQQVPQLHQPQELLPPPQAPRGARPIP